MFCGICYRSELAEEPGHTTDQETVTTETTDIPPGCERLRSPILEKLQIVKNMQMSDRCDLPKIHNFRKLKATTASANSLVLDILAAEDEWCYLRCSSFHYRASKWQRGRSAESSRKQEGTRLEEENKTTNRWISK